MSGWRESENKWEINYQELAHVILETEAPSVSWTFRKASGVFQSESENLRTWGADAVNLKQGGRNKGLSSSFLMFWAVQALDWLDEAQPWWRGKPAFLRRPFQMLIKSRNSSTDRIFFNLGSPHPQPVKLIEKSHHYECKCVECKCMYAV